MKLLKLKLLKMKVISNLINLFGYLKYALYIKV